MSAAEALLSGRATDVYLACKAHIESRKALFSLAAAFEKSGETEAARRCYQLFAKPTDEEENVYRKFRQGGRVITAVDGAHSAVNYVFACAAANQIYSSIKMFFREQRSWEGFVGGAWRYFFKNAKSSGSGDRRGAFDALQGMMSGKMSFAPENAAAVVAFEYRLRLACTQPDRVAVFTAVPDIYSMSEDAFAERLLSGNIDLCGTCASLSEVFRRSNFIISADAVKRLGV